MHWVIIVMLRGKTVYVHYTIINNTILSQTLKNRDWVMTWFSNAILQYYGQQFFLLNCWSSLLSRSFACLTYQSMITNLIWDVISRSSFTCKIMNGLQKISKSNVVVYELRNTSILYWYLNIDSGDKRWILRSLRNFGTNFDG